jgi:hypothetical protein
LAGDCSTCLPRPLGPGPAADNAAGEEDERAYRQQVQAAAAMVQASLNLLAAHVFSLYGDRMS